MTQVPIEIPPGVIVDDTTFSVGQSAWSDMNNCRFWRGQPQVIGGWQRLVTTALTGICRSIFPWSDNSGQLNIAFGTNSNLQLWTGGQLYDITPGATSPVLDDASGNPLLDASGNDIFALGGGFTPGAIDGTGGAGYGTGTYGTGLYGEPSEGSFFPLTWSLSPYGQNLIACPRGQTIFQWTNNPALKAQPLAAAPANVTYMLVTNTRQIMAFGCSDALTGVFNPRLIRFSDIEAPTVWQSTVENNAGDFVLPGSGQIVGAALIGNYIFVWTDNGLYQGAFDPTLDAAGQANGWLFEQVGENCGLIGPNAMVILASQVAYWFGSNGQFHACTLGGVPQIIPCPLQEDVFANVAPSQQAKIVASSCAEFGEIRFDYPDQRDMAPSPGFLADASGNALEDDTGESILTLPADVNGVENSRYIVYSTGGNVSVVAGYNTINTVWSKGFMVRTAYVDAGPSPYPLATDYAGDIYYHEAGQSADGAAFDAYAETADFYLGNADNLFTVRTVWPDIHAQVGAVNFSIKMRIYPQDPTLRIKGPFSLAPGQSKKDFMATGRIARLRYESTSAPMFWRLGKPVYDAVQGGTR